jgi:hypothetical protein
MYEILEDVLRNAVRSNRKQLASVGENSCYSMHIYITEMEITVTEEALEAFCKELKTHREREREYDQDYSKI